REMASPQRGALVTLARDRPPWSQQPGERKAARMLGQMDEEVVAPGTQCAQQRPFGARLVEHPLLFPVTVDRMQLRDRRMAREHRRGFRIDERVDLDPRSRSGEC